MPLGSLIASSTSSGDVADDGAYGRNSPYTKHLKVLIQQPGWPIERVFREVRKKVLEETHSKQIPWESTYLTDEFYFVPSGKAN